MVKNQYEQQNQFVFTLSEDNPPKQQAVASTTTSAATMTTDVMPEWERRLEQLRQHKKKQDGGSVHHEDTKITKPSVAARKTRRPEEHGFNLPPAVTGTVAGRSAYTRPNPRNNNLPQPNNEVLLDPVQRERVYRAYLKQWQQQSTLEAQQQESALNDTALLIQEDWLAAQNCLQRAPIDENLPSNCTIQLKGNQSTVLQTETNQNNADGELPATTENGQPIIHVHMHVIEPRGTANRAVACISEQALLQQLSEKLRPHLADVLSGMVRVAVQKHTAGLVSTLQRELLAEVPAAVEDVLQHNLAQVMSNFKKKQR
ncbi:hypothetical protein [Snodgrassella sp. ESL0253]|uniref:hypothetical protein n=1 Tax=Snodgrassella sp. ESL0253 TaxID=2705031 RepID=UPI0015818AD4|nr:hypothetical protein [Snodgrassella sp. ESL0253]NUE67119.1 hypothetical protein [Snodgrassella sp. ESL0253]